MTAQWCVHCFLSQVLDMCAAPGSKTAQLIEYLHKDENSVPGEDWPQYVTLNRPPVVIATWEFFSLQS